MAFLSGSPAMSDKTFQDATFTAGDDVMTAEGTVMRALLMIVVIIGASFVPWHVFFSNFSYSDATEESLAVAMGSVSIFLWGGLLVGFVLSMVIIFKQTMAPLLALPYALCEGFALGGISAMYEVQFQGIVFQAMASTFAIFFVMLLMYRMKIIKPTKRFQSVIVASTVGIAFIYIGSMILGFFGVRVPGIFDNGLFGILFSAFICVIASLSLILDFKVIEDGVARRAPKYMSWYGAFAMMVTIVWLYLNILRLLSKLRSRD